MMTEQVLQDVEEARLMVISWRRERYEKQIARAAVTLRRMRQSRMWRMLIARLSAKTIRTAIKIEREEVSTLYDRMISSKLERVIKNHLSDLGYKPSEITAAHRYAANDRRKYRNKANLV